MRNNKLLSLGIILAVALAIAGFVIAESQQDLQLELDSLSSELVDSGYDWLVDYSGGKNI